jgi:hypothetical protein
VLSVCTGAEKCRNRNEALKGGKLMPFQYFPIREDAEWNGTEVGELL